LRALSCRNRSITRGALSDPSIRKQLLPKELRYRVQPASHCLSSLMSYSGPAPSAKATHRLFQSRTRCRNASVTAFEPLVHCSTPSGVLRRKRKSPETGLKVMRPPLLPTAQFTTNATTYPAWSRVLVSSDLLDRLLRPFLRFIFSHERAFEVMLQKPKHQRIVAARVENPETKSKTTAASSKREPRTHDEIFSIFDFHCSPIPEVTKFF
jgi:hypothetical protein